MLQRPPHYHALLHLCKMHLPPLREVQAGLELCDGKLNHLALQKVPARSTLADDNKKRNSDVFDTLVPRPVSKIQAYDLGQPFETKQTWPFPFCQPSLACI